MDQHQNALKTLCRICTKKLGRVSYDVLTPAEKKETSISLIEHCFGVTPMTDTNPTRYTWSYSCTKHHTIMPRFCNSCYLTMNRMKKATKEGTVYRTSLKPNVWPEHTGVGCITCSVVNTREVGGRPKTKHNIQGCPKQLLDHIKSVASPR